MESTAKLFMHGRSQAVRLPKEFRFEGAEVKVTKIGDRVILEPIRPGEREMPWGLIDQLFDTSFMADGREQPDMPEDEVLFE